MELFHINLKHVSLVVLESVTEGDLVSRIEWGGYLQKEHTHHIFTQMVCSVHYTVETALHIAHRNMKLCLA